MAARIPPQGDGDCCRNLLPAGAPPEQLRLRPSEARLHVGGSDSTNPEVWGPQDRRPVPVRDDVLVYHFGAAGGRHRNVPPGGPGSVCGLDGRRHRLRCHPDRRTSRRSSDSHLRGHSRRDVSRIAGAPDADRTGELYEYTISLWETSHVFACRASVTAGGEQQQFSAVRGDQNTGLPLGASAEIKIARQTILSQRGAAVPSGVAGDPRPGSSSWRRGRPVPGV